MRSEWETPLPLLPREGLGPTFAHSLDDGRGCLRSWAAGYSHTKGPQLPPGPVQHEELGGAARRTELRPSRSHLPNIANAARAVLARVLTRARLAHVTGASARAGLAPAAAGLAPSGQTHALAPTSTSDPSTPRPRLTRTSVNRGLWLTSPGSPRDAAPIGGAAPRRGIPSYLARAAQLPAAVRYEFAATVTCVPDSLNALVLKRTNMPVLPDLALVVSRLL
jgi:hypothetical protein